MKYDTIKALKPEHFRRCTGVTQEIFETMVGILTEAYHQKHSQGGRKPKLSIPDQLLLTLSYYREYRTQFHIGLDYGVSEATVCKTIKWVESTLIKHPAFSLPSKKELWQNEDIEVILIDATEIPIERPKKSKKTTIQGKRNDIP